MEKLFDKQDLIYICSPLSAPTKEEIRKNMAGAKYYSWYVAVEFGGRTIAPHSFLPDYLDDHIPQERQVALDFGLSVLSRGRKANVCGQKGGLWWKVIIQTHCYLSLEEECASLPIDSGLAI